MNTALHGSAIQTIAIQLANAMIEHLEFKAMRQGNRKGYNGFMQKQAARGGNYSRQRANAVKKMFDAEGVRISISDSEKLAVGMKLLELVTEATGLFTIETKKSKRGNMLMLGVTETLQGWLDNQHNRCNTMDPVKLRMLVRPRRWRSPSYGGYLTPRVGNRFVKQRNKAYHEELRSIDIDDVYASVNHVQDTAWQINTRVLDVMREVWSSGGSLGGLPRRDDARVPARPHDIDSNEEAKAEWKREAATVYAANAQEASARIALMQGLWTARRFAEEGAIYFTHELDFRGRVYPIPTSGPSPQGCDWQKALIHFAEAKPVGEEGKRWLMIHLANLFGVDKVSFDERVQWVVDHTAQIIDSGLLPLDGERFWTTADSPWCALAACMEYVEVLDHGIGYASRLPVALDGSCLGLQHFSAMLRDEAGGRTVNLLPTDKPADVYSAVAAAAQKVADETPFITYTSKVGGEEQEFTIPNPWIGGKVSRKIAKRPTMTYCYSASCRSSQHPRATG